MAAGFERGPQQVALYNRGVGLGQQEVQAFILDVLIRRPIWKQTLSILKFGGAFIHKSRHAFLLVFGREQ